MKSGTGPVTIPAGGKALEIGGAAALIVLSIALLATPYPWLALLFPLSALGLVFFGRFPEAAYYLIVFLIPYGAYRKISGLAYIINIPWMIALALLVILLLKDLRATTLIERLRSRLWLPFFLFFSVGGLSALLSPYPRSAFEELFLLVIAYLFVSFGFLLIDGNGLRRTMPAVLITSVSLGSLVSLASHLFDLPFFRINVEGTAARATGFATDPNNMSLMIIFALPLIAFFAIHARRRALRTLMVFLLGINVFAIVFTFSRGGFLVLILCAILLALEHGRTLKPRHMGFLLAAFAAAALAVMIAVPPEYWTRQKTLSQSTASDSALARRTSYLVVAKDALRSDPFLGTGLNTYPDVYAATPYARQFASEEGENFYDISYRRRAHNTYLEVAVGTGLLGLSVFLAILATAFRNFTDAGRFFAGRGDLWTAALVRSYRTGFLLVLAYFFIYSDLYHKYFLLSLALSQAAYAAARREGARAAAEIASPT